MREGFSGIPDDEVRGAREAFVEDFDDGVDVGVRIRCDDKRTIDFGYPDFDEGVVERWEEKGECV